MKRAFSRLLPLLLVAWAGGAFAADELLISNALIMTMKPGEETPFVGYVAVANDGKISAIGAGGRRRTGAASRPSLQRASSG